MMEGKNKTVRIRGGGKDMRHSASSFFPKIEEVKENRQNYVLDLFDNLVLNIRSM